MGGNRSIPTAPGDYSRPAGIYLEILGWVQLTCFNFAGIAMIYAGQRVRQHNKKWWWVAVLLCSLQAGVAVLLAVSVLLHRPGTRLIFWGDVTHINERWLLTLLLLVLAAIFAFPVWWLLAPATRRSLRSDLKGRCINCGYDLRASKDRCPECGLAIPFEQSDQYAQLLNQVR